MSTSFKEDFIRRMRDPSLPSPPRFEPTKKAPGSLVLELGKFVEVR